MSPNDNRTADEMFSTFAALQSAHAELLGKVGNDLLKDENPRIIQLFVRSAVATGTRLDGKDDRAMAQGLINFWAARMSAATRAARDDNAPRSRLDLPFEESLLAEFDPAVWTAAANAAELWLKQKPADKTLAGRIALRLTRLPTEGMQVDAVPTIRSALYDLDTPERVDSLLEDLSWAGVIRISQADEHRMDRIALRSGVLLAEWPSLAGWLAERARFRSAALDWHSGNPAAPLLTGVALEEARNYHDRNTAEREFVIASAYCQQRDLESAVYNRRAKIIWMALAGVAATGWIGAGIGWSRAADKVNRINELVGDLYTTNGLSEERLIEAETAKGLETTAKRLAEERRAVLERRQRLTDLRSLVSTLAALATARIDNHEDALRRWDQLAAKFHTHEFDRIKKLNFDRMRKSALDPTNRNKVSSADIDDLQTIRDELLKDRGPEVDEAFRLAQAQAFDLVEVSARGLVAAFGPDKTYAEAEPFARHFWAQYWGEMLLVERSRVEGAMVDFGRTLAEIQAPLENADAASQATVQSLTKDYLKDARFKDFTDKAKKLNSAGIAQLKSEFKEIPPQVYATLLKTTGEKKIAADSAARLKPQLDALLKALTEERGVLPTIRTTKAQAL